MAIDALDRRGFKDARRYLRQVDESRSYRHPRFGVTYAQPPKAIPSMVFRRRQRDFSLGSLSWSDRFGRGCWGTRVRDVKGLTMTQKANLKRRVRARAAKTGEAYTAALRHVRQTSPDHPQPETKSVRLAVAQTTVFNDPRDISGLRASGTEMRRLMREAHKAGARLIHFPEGATCSPNKRIMSASGPKEIGPSDWTRFEWAILREELDATSETCARASDYGRSSGRFINSPSHTGRITACMSSPIVGSW